MGKITKGTKEDKKWTRLEAREPVIIRPGQDPDIITENLNDLMPRKGPGFRNSRDQNI